MNIKLHYRLVFHLLLACGLAATVAAQGQPGAESILEMVDRNLSSRNRIMEASMTIRGKRITRTLTMRSYSEGTKRAFTEYLSPAAEKGTKMLKLEGQLWIYTPAADRIIQISGQLLRQSVMGSDLSYEDMMDDRTLAEVYESKLLGSEKVGDRNTWIIELKARVADLAYHSQKLWVDDQWYVPLKQELYAKSGQLLKRTESGDVKQVQGRWFPHSFVFKDMLKQGDGTEFKITRISFDQNIPEYIFSKASLKM